MRDDRMRESQNVEDRRGMGGGAGPKLAIGGVGGIVLILIIVLLGGNPQQLLGPGGPLSQQGGGAATAPAGPATVDPAQEKSAQFAARVLGDTEDVWAGIFREQGLGEYVPAKLVLYTGGTETGCGFGQAAMGPFYCPADQTVYIDLTFFDELATRFGAPGDFAQAYVIAHEVGHHVQNLVGTSGKVDMARERLSKEEFNQLSVRLELQADFYAGVWAHSAQRRQLLEPGDMEEGLKAAFAVGDDALQKQSQGYVVPDSFTHGSSAQRMRWFSLGFQTGDVRRGDTFNTPDP